MCNELVAAGIMKCPSCGHEFPPRDIVKHESKASYLDVISDDTGSLGLPKVAISHIKASRHIKQGKADSFKITYTAGMAVRFYEWLFFDRGEFLARKAGTVWEELGGELPLPCDTDDALERSSELMCPTHLNVIKDGQYDRVIKRLYVEREPGDGDMLEAPPSQREFNMDQSDIPF